MSDPADLARLDQLEATITEGIGRQPNLNEREARTLTNSVKHDVQALWLKLVELNERQAPKALGYASWHAYCEAEFEFGRSRSYQLLNAGQVLLTLGNESTIVERPNEAVARELSPLVDEPDELREVWAEANTNGPPTAAEVHEIVQERVAHERPEHKYVHCPTCGSRVRADQPRPPKGDT